MSDVLERPPREPLVPPGGVEPLAADMTAIFSADCTLRTAQDRLAEHGQWLPVDGDPDATLGSLVETNSTGPLRLGYGGWRDLLLGIQFTNGRGELITAGGRTVKNVAGYDLTKFKVGNFGIFGRVVTLTTRTYRRPDGALLVRCAQRNVASLLATPLKPQWAMWSMGRYNYGYLGDRVTLDWYLQNLSSLDAPEIKDWTLDDDIRIRQSQWSLYYRPQLGGTPYRVSLPPAKLETFIQRIAHISFSADPAFGIVIGSAREDEAPRVREAAHALGGSVRFGSGPDDLDFSTNPGERQIIERLKAAFDPDNRLQPLPWQRR